MISILLDIWRKEEKDDLIEYTFEYHVFDRLLLNELEEEEKNKQDLRIRIHMQVKEE